MSLYKIDGQFVNEILSYLSQKPFSEVASIINRLMKIEEIEDKNKKIVDIKKIDSKP